MITASVTEMSKSDACWHALGANAKNGRRLSLEDQRAAIVLALQEFPNASSRAIAAHIGCAHSTVLRLKESGGADVPPEPTPLLDVEEEMAEEPVESEEDEESVVSDTDDEDDEKEYDDEDEENEVSDTFPDEKPERVVGLDPKPTRESKMSVKYQPRRSLCEKWTKPLFLITIWRRKSSSCYKKKIS